MTTETVTVSGEVIDGGGLAENEAVIRKGLSTFVDVGRALQRIRDEGQYLEAGFDTFEEYAKQRWQFAKSTASDYIGGAQVHDVIFRKVGRAPEPASLRVAKPLIALLNEGGEDAVTNAWSEINAKHEGDGPVTSTEVRRFFSVRANYSASPSWHELVGRVGDDLLKAQKDLATAEAAMHRKPNQKLREKAGRYASWAEDIAVRLRDIEAAA